MAAAVAGPAACASTGKKASAIEETAAASLTRRVGMEAVTAVTAEDMAAALSVASVTPGRRGNAIVAIAADLPTSEAQTSILLRAEPSSPPCSEPLRRHTSIVKHTTPTPPLLRDMRLYIHKEYNL